LLVGTGLTNYAMPLIRYVTDDLGSIEKPNCHCGREYPQLKAVEGRWKQELVYGVDKQPIPFAALNTHSDVYDKVAQFQFYQDKPGELTLNIVRGDGFGQEDTKRIRNELLGKLGESMILDIKFVDAIPRTSRGKFRFVVQKLAESDEH
jgi:phenylacetate-CoA ligase